MRDEGPQGGSGKTVRVGIERVHLEEDTGKSLHVGGATGRIHGAEYSLVDYNRAGIPLVEIVTKPIEGTDADAPVAARAYVTELRDLLRSLAVSDVRMEEGSLRCDVNTSLAPRGSGRWGTRTETKNVNSLRSVERAVRFEIERQAAVLDAGGRVIQETRHFHEDTGTTTPGRSKEEAQDYRYFPEPDLVPVAPPVDWVEQIRAALPETPSARRARLQAEWNLSETDMTALTNAGALDLVAETVAAGASPADARKWWLGELARRANEAGTEPANLAITPARGRPHRGACRGTGTLNDGLARQVIDGVLAGEGSPDEVVATRGLAVVSDEGALTEAIDEAIAANPDVVAKIRDGKTKRSGLLGRRGHEGHQRQSRRRPRPRADPAAPQQLAHPDLSAVTGSGRQISRRRANREGPNGARRRGRATAGAGAGATGRTRHFGPNEEGWGPRYRRSARRGGRRPGPRSLPASRRRGLRAAAVGWEADRRQRGG